VMGIGERLWEVLLMTIEFYITLSLALFYEAIVSRSKSSKPFYFNKQSFVWAELEILYSNVL
jgi:hypothetical protein